jgi:hypothetical protein
MTDRNDFDGLWRFLGLLDAMNYTSGGKEEYQHNKNGNHRPGEFYLVAAVDWWRFTAVIVGTPAELYNGICEQGENDYKNHRANGENEEREMENRVGWARLRFEHVGRL